MSGSRKTPSSLDYSSLLHELAARNWRRAVNDADWRRAEVNATRLCDSGEKLWQWLGHLEVGITCLARGRPSEALGALHRCERAYPDAQSLLHAARLLTARVHLMTHSAKRALEALSGNHVLDTALVTHCRCLAHAALGQIAEARVCVKRLEAGESAWEAALAHHGRAHLTESPAHRLAQLTAATAQLDAPNVPGDVPAGDVHLDFARQLAMEGDGERAVSSLEPVLELSPADWPVCHVRALFMLGHLKTNLGAAVEAKQLLRRFLLFWSGGELDRDDISQAVTWVGSY